MYVVAAYEIIFFSYACLARSIKKHTYNFNSMVDSRLKTVQALFAYLA